jgi:Tfp pilus assembly protein PilE
MRHRQRGMTFIGLLIIMAMAGVLVYAGIRLTPVYLNYMKIARTMDSVATEMQGNPDEAGIRRSLERHWEIEDIGRVDSTDVQIQKGEDGLTLHVAYDDQVPFIANVSLIAHFDKTVTIQ